MGNIGAGVPHSDLHRNESDHADSFRIEGYSGRAEAI
jgi:hypothetical protein